MSGVKVKSVGVVCNRIFYRWHDMIIIWTIVIGFVIGLLARALMPGRDPAGFIVTTLLGIAGALVGSMLGRVFGLYGEGESVGLVLSVLGAVILLATYRYLAPVRTVGRS